MSTETTTKFELASLMNEIVHEPIEEGRLISPILNSSSHTVFSRTDLRLDTDSNNVETLLSAPLSHSLTSTVKDNDELPSKMLSSEQKTLLPESTFVQFPILESVNPETRKVIGGIDDFKGPTMGTDPVNPTGNYIVDSLLHGWKWPGNTITYSFIPGSEFASSIPPNIQDEIRYILEDVIEPLISIDFQEVSEFAGDEGKIRYGYSNTIANVGVAFLGDPVLVLLNETHFDNYPIETGNVSHSVALHETLHALGFKHPGNYNGNEVGNHPGPFLPEDEDHTSNTVMSYHGNLTYPITPMPYDILALQVLYGGGSMNGGNSTYHFERPDAYSIDGQFFGGAPGFGGDPVAVKQTLFDTGGIDILNLQQAPSFRDYIVDIDTDGTGIVIDKANFNASTYDHLVSGAQYTTHRASTAIAINTWIENVIGSEGDDTIIGNSTDNTLHGGNGNDELTGNYGFDLLVGEGGDDILRGSTPSASIYDGDEVDTLFGGPGSDTFVIGDPGGKVYYTGVVRYASIMDFNQGEEGQNDKDLIQLSGSAKDYLFDETWPGGVGIFHEAGGLPDDLIAIVIGVNSLDVQTDVVFV